MNDLARLTEDTPLNTIPLMARGFRETVEELQSEGKLVHEKAIAFMTAGAAMVEAIAQSPVAAYNERVVFETLKQITLYITLTGGLGDSALTFKVPVVN